MDHFLMTNTPRSDAIDTALKLAREYVDGWYMIRDEEIPVYDLFVDHLRYDRLHDNWTAYVQPVGNPLVEYKIHYVPKAAKYVMSGTFIQKPIEIPEHYV
jgi:hypothetical protein